MARPMRIVVAPTALDRNGIGLIQTLVSGALEPILNGTLSSGYDKNAVCVAQTTSTAADLVINGVVGFGVGVARNAEERLIFSSASDNSGITYTITGTDKKGFRVSEVLAGSPASQKTFSTLGYYEIISIAASAAVTGNVEVGVNGVATFTTPQHVTLWATSDESGGSFTIVGTDRTGDAQTETLVGPGASATVVGVMNFATVTHVTSPAAATAVEVGVDGTCESGWLPLNYRGSDFNIGLAVDVSTGATLTYTVQHTFDDVQSATFVESSAVTLNHDDMAAKTADADGNYTNPTIATRLDVTAHTSGTATFNVVHAGRS